MRTCDVFFFNDPAPPEIYTLPLHDALPISMSLTATKSVPPARPQGRMPDKIGKYARSEEHTSELQSQSNLVCRLLLEKKHELIQEAADAELAGGVENIHAMAQAQVDPKVVV